VERATSPFWAATCRPEQGKYREDYFRILRQDSDLASFERLNPEKAGEPQKSAKGAEY
jgi:hypothetical protein